MEWIILAFSAFLASLLTFFSGFGLGTVLMPILAIFLPLPLAIALTAVVHLFHNILKMGFLWSSIKWKVVFQFGSAAGIAAIFGAWFLRKLSVFPPIEKYTFFGIDGEISVLHLSIGILLIFFATMQLFPNPLFQVKNLFFGGVLSGFFGGLSGNQGAFRSTFLINMYLGKEAFIATNAIIGAVVDLVRLVVYGFSFGYLFSEVEFSFFLATLGGAFSGVCLGLFLLPKMAIGFIQKTIATLLYLLGFLLVVGMI